MVIYAIKHLLTYLQWDPAEIDLGTFSILQTPSPESSYQKRQRSSWMQWTV